MDKTVLTIEFPLVFSQEELAHLMGLLKVNLRKNVAHACLQIKGVPRQALAARLGLHPSNVTQYFKASDLAKEVRDRLIAEGLPEFVLPPERASRVEAA
jgi:hypothetical protein